MANLIDGQFTEEHLFIAEGPDQQVSLGPGETVNLRDAVLDVAGKLEDTFNAVREKKAAVRRRYRDGLETEAGMQEKFREIDRLTAERVRSIADSLPVPGLEERADELEGQLTAIHPRLDPEDPEQAGDVALKAEETRKLLRDLDENERNRVLMEAAREDDRVTLMAYEDAPSAFPLVPEDELALAREVHIRRRYADRWQKVQNIRSATTKLRGNVNRAMSMVEEASGDSQYRVMPFPIESGTAGTREEVEAAASGAAQ